MADKVRVIGLTGKICAGKNLAADMLAESGFMTIDVDRLGHRLLQEHAADAARLFGTDILAADGAVDRRALGTVVFSDPAMLLRLEEFLHPLMKQRCREEAEAVIADPSRPGLVLNAAVLTRMGLDLLCDAVLFVEASLPLRLIRAIRARKMSFCTFLKRNRSQKDIRPVGVKNTVPVYTVSNNGTLRAFRARLGTVAEQAVSGKPRR